MPRENATPPAHREGPVLFYDGDCGFCHLWVRLLLRADPEGEVRFAPLGGDSFHRWIPVAEQEVLPDSLVLLTTHGRILTRSAAVVFLLDGLGGFWRLAGRVAGAVPRPAADAIYDGIARVRSWLAPKPKRACPVVPEPARSRFDP